MSTVVVFAGGDTPEAGIVSDLPAPDLVVAADGGYMVANSLGFAVDVLVGDLDSIDVEPADHVIVERHPADKDSTDLELAFDLISRDWPQRLVLVGGGGGRFDHELAIAHLITSPRWEAIDEIDWMSSRARAHVIRRHRQVHGDLGMLCSLLPCHGDAGGVSTKGLRWDLTDETLFAGAGRGVSNELVSPVVDITVGSGVLLAVFPVRALPE